MAKQTQKRAPKPSRRNRDNGKTKAVPQSKTCFAMVDLMRKQTQQANAGEHSEQRAG